MAVSVRSIRKGLSDLEKDLDVFEIFSGDATPGEGGAPDMPAPGEEDPGLSVSDGLAIGTFASLGLTGISYAVMRYSDVGEVRQVLKPMEALYQKIQIGKALEASTQSEKLTKLMEVLPYVGTPVKRMNIDAIWGAVADTLEDLDRVVKGGEAAITPFTTTLDSVHGYSKAAFAGFGTLSAVGVVATTLTAAFHDRATPLLDDLQSEGASLRGWAAGRSGKAVSELDFRFDDALSGLKAELGEIDAFAKDLPDFDGILALIAEAEGLFEPIGEVVADISGLVQPYEDFLGVAQVIASPIEGVLKLFENPPKVLPTIVGYETITPGFWLTVPDPTLTNPFRTKQVWVEPIKIPITGFKELFDPIPRSEVEKIIDLVVKIVGLPAELLEKALSPILSPIQDVIDGIMRPIIEKLNPFDDYLEDYRTIESHIAALRDKVAEIAAEIAAVAANLASMTPQVDPIEEIGEAQADGMATFFGGAEGEKIVGAIPEAHGGFVKGAVLQGNGGADEILGTRLGDLLAGGDGADGMKGDGGADMMLGGDGRDDLDGGRGRDLMFGGDGHDKLAGGGGKDRIEGGLGRDEMSGGAGLDAFVFETIDDSSARMRKSDLIMDFRAGKDVIDLRGIDADAASKRDDAFEWLGENGRFGSDEDGGVAFRRIDRPGSKKDMTLVRLDVDDDGRHEAVIRLKGLMDLDRDDFLL